MTYQIQLLVKADVNQPLWTYYMTTPEGSTTKTVWETTDKTILDEKVTELLSTYVFSSIKVINPVEYTVDVVIP